ncbi:type IV pili methyl-accepting chemotaxis transducer N-terminal domain-containing protein [Stappia sp. F7233]|uniref:Type IV pili methyl-accepting chemotaxis transducer N-terminal domain-containing protein n=1 Tax=Stappia albiluteola TaxID=2758565 RepID=A0A839AD10_9HYPH|nr:type IV pili methyl-accepting chemotaxis transducer N-terminal domain-containing protein [Stappia albiluteola]MBA5777005.1 type IV pili methyl-accepting chemotaxis transducer N-terminal domain-containing protein [Stappia albiluteola]
MNTIHAKDTGLPEDAALSAPVFASLINLAGRQRMLSQRAGLFLLQFHALQQAGMPPSDDDIEAFGKTADDFRAAHRTLVEGNRETGIPKLFSGKVRDLLFGTARGNQTIEHFCERCCHYGRLITGGGAYDLAEFLRFVDFIKSDLLKVLQSVVAALEGDFLDFNKRSDERRAAETAAVLSALGQIQKSAHMSRLVAFNAKISSIRAGDYGREFGALTDELKKISDEIGESSKLIVRNISTKVA